MKLGNLHKLFEENLALGLGVPRGLREWEHGRVCSAAWGPTRSYKPTAWARAKEVGYMRAQDEEVGGGW